MTHNSGLSSAGLICCYAMILRQVDAESLVIHPHLLATGTVNLYTAMAGQLALVGLRCLRVPHSCEVQGLRDGVTLSGRVYVPVYVLDRIEGSS